MKTEAEEKGLMPEAEVLLIDFEHEFMDVRDPVDGVCRVPLEKKFAQMPTPAELTACAKKVLSEINQAEVTKG
jgi:hypothetical protein